MNALNAPRAPRRQAIRRTAAVAAGLGLAAAGMSASAAAQAAPAPTTSLSTVAQSLPSQGLVGGGLAAPAAATSTSVSVPFTWENGAPVKATVIGRGQAEVLKGSQLGGYRVGAADFGGNEGVLPDGRVVGLVKGKLVVQEKNGKLRNYYKGKFSPRLEFLSVQGSYVLGFKHTRKGMEVYLFKGTATAPSARTVLPTKGQWAFPVLWRGRVYYSQPVLSGDKQTGSEVRSVKQGGSASKLEAKNGANPQILSVGLSYVTLSPFKADGTGGEVTGLRTLTQGRTVFKYTGKRWPSSQWLDDAGANIVTSAGGQLVVIDNVGRKGQLVMDVSRRKAWLLTPPKNAVAVTASASSSRAAWTWAKPTTPTSPGLNEVAVFDAATAKYTIYTTNNRASLANINGKALEYSTYSRTNSLSYASGLVK